MPRVEEDDSWIDMTVAAGNGNGEAFCNVRAVAVNLSDVSDDGRLTPLIRDMMVAPHLERDPKRIVRVDPKVLDEAAVVFTCPLLQAACICDTLRSHDRRAGVFPTRVYLLRKGWSKMPGDALLTVIKGEQVRLNPQLFFVHEVVELAVAGPRQVRRMTFGGDKDGSS